MDRESSKAPLARLNEMIARCDHNTEFQLVDESGTANDKNFRYRLTIGDVHVYTGEGKSKKLAKNNTALEAINNSEAWYTPRPKRNQEGDENLRDSTTTTENMEIDY